ncbi:MAG: hypothetical protein QOD07_2425, partial [Frankiaceae bacterium]|nr:hypothetical protein [Frankiaceae bacterium]
RLIRSTGRRVAACLALGIVTGVATPTSAAFAAGGPLPGPQRPGNNATFGIQPAGPKGVDARSYFTFNATPGAVVVDDVAVTNYSVKPLVLSMYSTDAVNTISGDFALLPQTQRPHDIGAWMTLPPYVAHLAVPARHRVIVPFRVAVPPTATPGDHVGGIAVTLTSTVTSPSGQRLRLLQSVGTRLFLRVSGPLTPRLSVTHLSVHYDGSLNPVKLGGAVISYVVTNTGNVALGGRPHVSVSGLLADKTAAHLPDLKLLLPGSSVTEHATLHGVLPQFVMSAHVSVRALVIPGTSQPPTQAFTASRHFLAIPWALLALIAALAFAAFLVRVWRTRLAAARAVGRHRALEGSAA